MKSSEEHIQVREIPDVVFDDRFDGNEAPFLKSFQRFVVLAYAFEINWIAINVAGDCFYEHVRAETALNHFFSGAASMPRLKGYQMVFQPQALGGPKQYSGASMEAVHARLSTEQHHFDLVATHRIETLRGLGFPEKIIDEVAGAATPLVSKIVNTPARYATA